MTIKKALDLGKIALKDVAQRPAFEAEILLSHFLKMDRVGLILNSQKEISPNILSLYIKALKNRKKHFPIEYITKKVSFYSEEFYINQRALIPRPETELLIDEVLKNVEIEKKYNIAEIGTGSGVISIILALKLKNSNFFATDISKDALEVAKKNIEKFKLTDKIVLKNCSYIDCLEEKIDILVSNPPYISNSFNLEKNVLYEPHNALFGGEKGDEILKKIIDIAIEKKVKLLACEMGYDQRESISKYCEEKGLKPKFYKDFAGFDRGFVIKIGGEDEDFKMG
ncbi:peptide chain release factor N(5)-glutamine methyltransferase [Nitrosophilus kaiyonis]|uniref:peptide chain release factor N(5)-glutamine methyltransferase n=1 Tax=Nitrosophilus kaiyonis TaxID=2930200 RepID=UPI0024931665|nr:peptide chain release factor N(5)-glutamine methyltransferase [Nitrosophilus kaiyonis]